MRILWCHPNAWSGEYKMMAYLAAQGHEICALQGDRKLQQTRKLQPYFRTPEDGIKTLWYNPSRGVEKLLTFPLDRWIRRSPYRGNVGHRMWMIRAAAQRFKPDVVYCSEGFGYGVAAAWLKKLGLLNYPLVVQFIGGDLMDEPAADYGVRRTPTSHRLLGIVTQHATLLKPVSGLLAEILVQEGASPEKIRMSPSHLVASAETLTATFLERQRISREFRAAHGIAESAPVVVTLSGNWMGKGTHLLAQAWAAIREVLPACRWILAGPQPDWYQTHVKPLVDAYPQEIIQTGELKGAEVFATLAAGDLHVVPTLADGLNMAVVEAAAVGVPSLVTDKAGIANWVGALNPSLVLPAGDVLCLAKSVVSYLQNTAEAKQQMSQAFREMSHRFSLEGLGDRLAQIWAEAKGLQGH